MLNELLVKIKSKESIQNKLNDLILHKNDLESKIIKQKEILRKENNDVEKLEYGKLSSFFYELIGSKDKKLSKEKEEAYQAQLKYDSLQSQLNALLKDISYYENKLKEIKECEIKYTQLYASKLDELKTNNPNLLELENDMLKTISNIKELNEAIHAGEIALEICDDILNSLNKAKGWSQYDMFGGGLMSDLMKYDHLDYAQEGINDLQSQLSRFKTELLDVHIDYIGKIEIDSFLKFGDFWFDGIFSDYAVYERIKNSINQIQATYDKVEYILKQLKQLRLNEENKEKQLKDKIDKIILES